MNIKIQKAIYEIGKVMHHFDLSKKVFPPT